MLHRPLAALALAVASAPSPAQTPLTTVRVASGLQQPVAVAAPPGDPSRLFVAERLSGRLLVIRDGALLPRPYLDLGGLVGTSGQQGLLSFAFAPDYASSGHVFVHYVTPGVENVVARYTVSAADPDLADPASAAVLWGPFAQPVDNHNGGHVAFGPDGMLYAAVGEGGAVNGHDPTDAAQRLDTPLGKLLRLDVQAPPPHVPPDNPFVGVPGALGEIWALGLRNPWRFSFDAQTGDLWIGDVGASALEEIDLLPAGTAGGADFGWPCLEGTRCTGTAGCDCADPDLVTPVHAFPTSTGCSVTGGLVYRGAAIPDLHGAYFFGDFCSGRVFSLRWDGTQVTELVERTAELDPGGGLSIDALVAFGEDADGELHLVDLTGEVYLVVPAVIPPQSYCSGKTSSLGCVPFLTTGGTPSASPPGDFSIQAHDVVPGAPGVALYGVGGPASTPFHGGTLCVKLPFRRLALQAAKPAPTLCPGRIRFDFNAFVQSGADPSLTAGATVHLQVRQRDPADPAGFGDSLTDAVRFTILD